MAMARARRDAGLNYWPGFVDALSTLVLGIIFMLTIFVVVQFYLTQEVTGKDTALSRLTAQIAQLTDLLSLEKTGKLNLEEQISQLHIEPRRRRRRARPLSAVSTKASAAAPPMRRAKSASSPTSSTAKSG